MKRILILAALCAPLCAVTACSRETPEEVKNAAATTNTPAAAATAGPAGDGSTFTGLPKKEGPDYVGRYIGVEGMFLTIKHAATPGRYRMEMQWDLDHKGEFRGEQVGDTIVFERNGVRETLRPTNGDATGLKYLAGKTDCLTVKPGEGYCKK
ncbi:hypothetical protein [Sphingomonas sanguinis]|uniref:Lipoprotein n=1 Tax=Sphingomonas sanguinis TaxID=33051 RepID=A0A147J8S4_9SPHN|nr:hypothetical protein [Sphingomonas sanguinis]KTW13664.1 hypothetical protein NS258_08530 [Sphingomonas sanguinis]